MLDSKNCLKQSYDKYERRTVRRYIKEISPERRKELLEEIKVRANLVDKVNGNAYKEALKCLKEEPNG